MVATMSRGSPVTKLSLADRFALWVSKSRVTDGLWIGSAQSDAEPALQRVEAALQLINRCAPLHYRRIKNSLSRIWVQLASSAWSRLLSAFLERLLARRTCRRF